MRRPGYTLMLLFLVFLSLNIKASYRSEVYAAYINNNIENWKIVIDKMEALPAITNDLLLELVNYQYGYIAWCIRNKKNNDANRYLGMAEHNIARLSKESRYLSIVNAYKAAFYGFRIALNRIMAPFIGLKIISCARMAISLDEKNPFGYIQYGNLRFYLPYYFGGSKKEALKYYLKALDLMEHNEKELDGNWNYLSLLVVIAQSYTYLDDFPSSFLYIDKILKLEPDFGWAKNELYAWAINKRNKNLR